MKRTHHRGGFSLLSSRDRRRNNFQPFYFRNTHGYVSKALTHDVRVHTPPGGGGRCSQFRAVCSPEFLLNYTGNQGGGCSQGTYLLTQTPADAWRARK